MHESRLQKVQAILADRQLDSLLISRPENRLYLTGFTGSSGVVLITREKAFLITDFRYVEQAGEQAPAFEVVKAETTATAALAELCQQLSLDRIGFESDFVTVDAFRSMKKSLEGRDLLPASGLVESLRIIKDESEIALMRKAAAIADEAWGQLLSAIKPGAVERDLAVELEFKMRRLGAEGPSFNTIVASGVRSALPHGVASDKVIQKGDLVTFDFGAQYQGYCSDTTRTVMVGEPSPKQRKIYEIVLEAQVRGVRACRPGMTGQELDEVCRSYIREKGYADAFGHGTGHGVGLAIHEEPRVSIRGSDTILKPGMVVTIEPGIYLPGWGGVRIEDSVLVTESGCERLTQSSKELMIL